MAPGTMHVGVSVVVLLRTCIYALGCGVNLIIRKYLWHCFIMGPLYCRHSAISIRCIFKETTYVCMYMHESAVVIHVSLPAIHTCVGCFCTLIVITVDEYICTLHGQILYEGTSA